MSTAGRQKLLLRRGGEGRKLRTVFAGLFFTGCAWMAFVATATTDVERPDTLEARDPAEVAFAEETNRLLRVGLQAHDAEKLTLAAERMIHIPEGLAVGGIFDSAASTMDMGAMVQSGRSEPGAGHRRLTIDEVLSAALEFSGGDPEIAKRLDAVSKQHETRNDETLAQGCLWGFCCGQYGCWSWCSWW